MLPSVPAASDCGSKRPACVLKSSAVALCGESKGRKDSRATDLQLESRLLQVIFGVSEGLLIRLSVGLRHEQLGSQPLGIFLQCRHLRTRHSQRCGKLSQEGGECTRHQFGVCRFLSLIRSFLPQLSSVGS